MNTSPIDVTDSEPKLLVQLKLSHTTRSFDHFLSRRERFEVNPPYQRGSVWDVSRRRELIKSALMGLPIGTITVNDRGYQKSGVDIAVVDGKQRLEALQAFADSEFAIPAAWVDPKDVLETEPMDYRGRTVPGVRYSGTSIVFGRRFANMPLQVTEAAVSGVDAEAEIFMLINFAGVAQTDADRANATVVLTNGASDRTV
ncbi:DUF262 domain-containing protein (plasmid) [Glaciihabitans sp. INWT7]|uniref:DUF262 domain-containing protein n=1 Tax=Glaciihabitans sp. INWT7 TaxID=2596912 RepID=UPI00162372C7|nr:DUF262 domain-containing protein [Glaciihabitans sp. INWT7]QNE48585.1 DUF262 domain-containing protein [Glaciihabitans sp. INWT7]